LTRCIYDDPDKSNKFNKGDSGLLVQMYLQLSKSGLSNGRRSSRLSPTTGGARRRLRTRARGRGAVEVSSATCRRTRRGGTWLGASSGGTYRARRRWRR